MVVFFRYKANLILNYKHNTLIMKTLKITAAFLTMVSVIAISCSKDDDAPVVPTPVIPDTRLVLPATLENSTQLTLPDGVNNGGNCGSTVTPGTAENSIEITADGIIADPTKLSIEVDITHPFGGDIVLELFTPSGESVGLIKRIGSSVDTSCGTNTDFVVGNKITFNAANATQLVGGAPSFITGNYAQSSGTSTYPAAVPMTSLATFLTGKNIKGVWKMKIYDCGVGDVGKLNSWKLKFEVGALQ